MINGKDQVYIEQKGKLVKTNVQFADDNQIIRLIERIIMPLGRRIDADSPMVDARLPDGSRVNAIIPPVAIDGPSITIRKFQKGKLAIDQLIEIGSLSRFMADFIRACVLSKFNILISGGTGTGKTTLLNALSSFIPEEERIVTIEDAAELMLTAGACCPPGDKTCECGRIGHRCHSRPGAKRPPNAPGSDRGWGG